MGSSRPGPAPLYPAAMENRAADMGAMRYVNLAKQAELDAARAAGLASISAAFAQDDATTAGLVWGHRATKAQSVASSRTGADGAAAWGGDYSGGGVVAAATLTLEAEATNYVEFNVTTREVTANTDGFTDGTTAFDLWEIETGPAGIIRRTDRRAWLPSNGTVTEEGDGEGHDDMSFEGDSLEFEEETVAI